jgi:hypothetical protein
MCHSNCCLCYCLSAGLLAGSDRSQLGTHVPALAPDQYSLALWTLGGGHLLAVFLDASNAWEALQLELAPFLHDLRGILDETE